MPNPPDANDHRFAQIARAEDPLAAEVRKVVEQYIRGLLTEGDLLRALRPIDPDELEEAHLHDRP